MRYGQPFNGIDELSDNLEDRVKDYGSDEYNIFFCKYLELLVNVFSYKHDENYNTIDFSKLEQGLRLGKGVAPYGVFAHPVIARNKKGHFIFCGFLNSHTQYGSLIFQSERRFVSDDIDFFVDKSQFPENMIEIVDEDNYIAGEFVVVKNKTINLVPDAAYILHKMRELSEIQATRYHLSVAAKTVNFFTFEDGSESMRQAIEKIYNGAIAIGVTEDFDVTRDIHSFDKTHLADVMIVMKRAYQNVLSELNTGVGINALGVEKESGVSDVEAKGNSAYVTPLANMYLKPRQKAFDRLYRRYKDEVEGLTPVTVFYNDEIVSKLTQKAEYDNYDRQHNLNDRSDVNVENYGHALSANKSGAGDAGGV